MMYGVYDFFLCDVIFYFLLYGVELWIVVWYEFVWFGRFLSFVGFGRFWRPDPRPDLGGPGMAYPEGRPEWAIY